MRDERIRCRHSVLPVLAVFPKRIDAKDMPTVRAVARAGEQSDYKMSAFIMAIVKSDAFQMKASPAVTETAQGNR